MKFLLSIALGVVCFAAGVYFGSRTVIAHAQEKRPVLRHNSVDTTIAGYPKDPCDILKPAGSQPVQESNSILKPKPLKPVYGWVKQSEQTLSVPAGAWRGVSSIPPLVSLDGGGPREFRYVVRANSSITLAALPANWLDPGFSGEQMNVLATRVPKCAQLNFLKGELSCDFNDFFPMERVLVAIDTRTAGDAAVAVVGSVLSGSDQISRANSANEFTITTYVKGCVEHCGDEEQQR